MDFHKDYYMILGLEKEATREQLKSAFRKLIMKYHPDRNPGNLEAEERTKEINEAFDVLGSDINRFIYDEYKKKEQEEQKAAFDKERQQESASPNKRTYKRKKAIRKERRVYIKGFMDIKFWAELEGELDVSAMKETTYRLNPVSAEAIITDSDIHDFRAPIDFQKAYSQSQIFKTPLPQSIKCKIIHAGGSIEYYDLSIQDIRITDPVLTDIVKHENQSLGTLKGAFYGYILRVDIEEEIEQVTECFGPTGKTERKKEDVFEFIRHEYYHKDCTTYWGPWIKIATHRPTTTTQRNTTSIHSTKPVTADGCAQYWWIPALILILFVWPQLILGLILLFLTAFLISVAFSAWARLMPALGLFLLLLLIYNAVSPSAKIKSLVKQQTKASYDTLISERHPVATDSFHQSRESSSLDTLISNTIRWRDYDSISYTLTLSVLSSDVNESAVAHHRFEPPGIFTSLTPVYYSLEKTDENKLERVYSSFDSIRTAKQLGKASFAKMVVSCIQSIPYYLVLDNSCGDDHSDDEFINNYLQQCNRDCCVGDIKYGVKSPVEFFSDLKGDCDTRALVIYSILKRFDYNVALLTSQYYKHAMVAVNFETADVPNGLSININNRNYYLWETTSSGFQAGQVPPGNSNLSNWEIALLNEKNTTK